MLNLIAIFFGGGVGCVARYLISQIIKSLLATFFVNIIGSMLLGFIFGLIWQKMPLPNSLKLAICVGFCGGISTFSLFSLECFEFIREQQYFNAIFYALITVIGCIFAVAFGAYITKFIKI